AGIPSGACPHQPSVKLSALWCGSRCGRGLGRVDEARLIEPCPKGFRLSWEQFGSAVPRCCASTLHSRRIQGLSSSRDRGLETDASMWGNRLIEMDQPKGQDRPR